MLMLLLKSFVCAVVMFGVVFGVMEFYSRLNDFGQTCFMGTLCVVVLTFCFFCVFADM